MARASRGRGAGKADRAEIARFRRPTWTLDQGAGAWEPGLRQLRHDGPGGAGGPLRAGRAVRSGRAGPGLARRRRGAHGPAARGPGRRGVRTRADSESGGRLQQPPVCRTRSLGLLGPPARRCVQSAPFRPLRGNLKSRPGSSRLARESTALRLGSLAWIATAAGTSLPVNLTPKASGLTPTERDKRTRPGSRASGCS